jgi:hypothetical protein
MRGDPGAQSGRQPLVWIVVLAVLAWGAFYIFRTSFVVDEERVFTLWDDGMISMRYARNLAAGHGLVWNPGEVPVQGFSNLGVTLVMALVHLFPLSDSKLSLPVQILNLGLLAGLVIGGARLFTRFFEDTDAWSTLAASVAVALCAPAAVWALQGSDVGFVAAWLVACMLLLCGSEGQRDRMLPWLVGFGVLIRPDTALFAGIILCMTLRQGGAHWRRFGTGAAVGLVVGGGMLLLGQLYYGDPLPNTVYLKVTGSPRAEVLASGLQHLGERLPSLLAALTLAAVAVWRAGPAAVGVQTAALLVVSSLAYNTWVGGDWLRLYESRFVAPTLPLLLLLAVGGAKVVLDAIVPAERPRQALLLTTVVAVAWISNPREAASDWLTLDADTMYRTHNERHFRYGRYLRARSDPSTTLAVYWGGVPPYFSERFAIDVLGKSDRHIARQPSGHFRPGHSKTDWDYVLNQRKPDVFLHATDALKKRGDFRRDYYSVQSAELAFYVRKQSLGKLHGEWLILRDLETGELRERRGIQR